jgi:hypothetical protein
MADYGRDKGLFIPTTQVWDTSEIYEAKGVSEDLRELLVRMYQNLNNMAMAVNKKDTGIYPTDEFVCGQVYFSNPAYDSSTSTTPVLRQVYRKVINFGTLPTAAEVTKTALHGIAADTIHSITRLYGGSTDPVNKFYIALPCVANAGNNIALWADNTRVVINAFGTDRSTYTLTYVVMEYIKN